MNLNKNVNEEVRILESRISNHSEMSNDDSGDQPEESGSFNIYEAQSDRERNSQIMEGNDEMDDYFQKEEEVSFDENEDFPDYGNEKNKELNEKVKETKKHIKLIDQYIQENKDRYRLLDEHFRDVKAVGKGSNARKSK